MRQTVDPIRFCRLCWPDMRLADYQREILYSVRDNEETYVPAGNMLGKDFAAAVVVLWYFLCHHPVRIITTSVKDDHLDVLWGEMDKLLKASRVPLLREDGGPLVHKHHEIRKVLGGREDGFSYLKGQVSKTGEGMSGHHADHTLLVVDEASGVPDVVHERGTAWARRLLVIGNTWLCENFFRAGVDGGDVPSPTGRGLFRKVIRVKAERSPNVRLALAEKAAGREPSGRVLIPGILDYPTYLSRRALWNPTRQCVGLDAEFPQDAKQLLFPPEWLNQAARVAAALKQRRRRAVCIGHDPGEGEADSAWAIVDRLGLIKLVSFQTPDTTAITSQTIALMREFGVEAKNVLLDRGGGGKQHADRLRQQGYNVRTVGFGEAPTAERRVGRLPLSVRIDQDEARGAYKDRRAEMYGILSNLLDPANELGFGLPAEYTELRRQLASIPRVLDDRGRLMLPPKRRRPGTRETGQPTMQDLIGRSPDDADALALAVFGMAKPRARTRATVGY